MNLTQLSISRPILIIVLFVVLGILGAFSYTQLRYELLPNIATPFVTVTTTWPGASPSELEASITRPIEEAVSTADQIKRITAQSLENVSLVTVEFRAGADADKALQECQRRVNDILATLPAGSKTPQVSKYSLADLPVLRVAVTSPLPPLELGALLRNQVKPRLAQVPGVGQITFVGLAETEVAVDVDARRLDERRLSILQITNAIRQANLNIPAGSIKDTDALYAVRVVGKTDDLDRLRDIVVAVSSSGQKTTLGEIATVRARAAEAQNVNRYNGRSSVGILVTKQSGANNVDVSEQVRAAMQKLQTEFPAQKLRFDVAQDGSEFTLAAADAVTHDLMLAIGLVALVMFVFLHSLRSSLIVMVAMPASLLSTFVLMNGLGFSLNLLTLLALSLVVGILVDDSIVVLESIYKQLEHAGGASAKEKRQAALDGRNEIGFAAVAITLVDVVVFVPLSLAPGLIGDLMREFALVVVISTLFSLLVSFTLTPMIASRFGKLEHLTHKTLMGRFSLWFETQYNRLSNRYRDVLTWALVHRKTVATGVIVLFIGALSLPILGFIGAEFTAPADKGEVQVIVQLPDGAKLEQTDSVAKRLETALRRMPDVTKVFTNVGANPDGFAGITTTNTAELNITFRPREQRSQTLAQLSRQVKEIIAQEPGLTMRVSPIGLLGSDATQPIIVIVNGADRAQVQTQARRIAEAMRRIAGTADIRLSGERLKPEVQLTVDREKLARYGLSTEEVGGVVRTALAGYDELKIQQNDQSTTVRVHLRETDRNRTDQMRRLTVINAQGQSIRLSQVADVREVFMPALLERKDRSNAVTIYSQLAGRPAGDIGEDLKRAVSDLNLPPAVRITYGGDLELQDDSFGKLGLAFGAAILFMYLIMVALYNSWLYPFVVLFSIPVALVGALLALALTMNSLNVFSILGLIMMLGLVAKNAILLVERANENRESGMNLTNALLDAGLTRLRPILMTTLAMVVGMLPIALASGPGSELKTGLAWALIGGLSSSMLLTLVFVPTIYYDVTRLRNWAAALLQKRRPTSLSTGLNRAIGLLPIISSLVAVSSGVSAQSTVRPVQLRMQDAVARVREMNGEVAVAKLDAQKADARRDEARRAWWPTLNGVAQYTHNIKPPVFFFPDVRVDPNTGALGFDNSRLTPVAAALPNAYSAAVNLAMPLVQPDLRINDRLAQNGQQQAREGLRAVQNRQVAEVKKLYLAALLAQSQQQLVRQSMARAGETLREARNRFFTQLATDADTLRAFVELENQRPDLSKLGRTVRQLTSSLVTLLDLPPGTDLILTDSLVLPDRIERNANAQTDPVAQAMSHRPDLRQLTLSLEQSRLLADLERTRRLPTLSLFGQVSTQAQLPNFDFSRSRWPGTVYAGVQLTVPIYNPANAPKLRQARLGQFQAETQLTYNRALITNEVQIAQYAVDEARDRLSAQDRVIAAAERSYALIRSRYRQGVAQWSEVADAELALQQAQSNRVQAIYDALVAQVNLGKSVGTD
ncbi:efflux RND transporter permease subunit [Spirosoma arcticum]